MSTSFLRFIAVNKRPLWAKKVGFVDTSAACASKDADSKATCLRGRWKVDDRFKASSRRSC